MRTKISAREIFLGLILVLVIIQSGIVIKQNNEIITLLNNIRKGGVRVKASETADVDPGKGVKEEPKEAEEFQGFTDVKALMEKALKFKPKIGKVGGEIVYAVTEDPKTFNLVLNKEASTSDVMRYIWDELVTEDYLTGDVAPRLATHWDVSEDGLVYTFYMRKDARWFDGKPVTADDVVFSYEILYNKDIDVGGKGQFVFRERDTKTGKFIEKEIKVEKVDDYTVRMTFPIKSYRALGKANGKIYPKHILKKYVDNGTFNTVWTVSADPKEIIGSGPWMLGEYKPGEQVVLKRNPNWWGRDAEGNRLPYLERIVFKIVPSSETALLKFKSGEIDFIGARTHFSILQPMQEEKNFKIFGVGPDRTIGYLAFNLNRGKDKETGKPFVAPYKLKWFLNRKFRQAMAHAIDRKTWIENFLNGLGYPLWSPLSPASTRFYNPNVTKYPFDLKKSAQLLDEIGYIARDGDGVREDPDGHKIEFTILTGARDERALRPVNMFISDLKKIGVKARYSILQYNTWLDRLWTTFDWECTFIGEIGGWEVFDIKGLFTTWSEYRFYKPNIFHNEEIRENVENKFWWEDKIDDLFNQYEKELDPEKRKVIGFEIQKILSDEIPLIYTIVADRVYAIRDKFGNFNPTVYFWPAIWGGMEYMYVKE